MNPIEIVLRTVAATSAVILAIAFARAHGAPTVSRLCGALLLLGVAGYLPCSAGVCEAVGFAPIALLAAGIPFFFWAWTESVMDDEFRLTPMPVIVGVTLLAMPIFINLFWNSALAHWSVIAHSVIGAGFVLAALVTVLRTWKEDLIESRRRLRAIVLIVSGTYTLIILMVELFLRTRPATDALQLLNAAALALMLASMAGIMLGPSDTLRRSFAWPARPSGNSGQAQPAAIAVRDLEQELVDRLHAAMTEKGMYRNADLSVNSLARFAGVTERRLREVINQRLGHKNFPSYVNAFRVEEVRARLADRRNDHLPVLTLALDAGFGSIVAFNRAFKDRFSITPTEFRAQSQSTAPSS